MYGYLTNIESDTLNNVYYRHVLYTTPNKHQQLVIMSLQPEEEIGIEVHLKNTQFIRIESGEGVLQIEDEYFYIKEGSAFIIPSGTYHNVINDSKDAPLKLYTIYTPANHPDGLIQKNKPLDEHD